MERTTTNLLSQGTEHEVTQRNRAIPDGEMTDNPKSRIQNPTHTQAADGEQLERSAEVFEMILQASPDAIENYITLKDIYRRLKRDADFTRITKGLAQVYLNGNQALQAAKQYADVLEIGAGDADVLAKLHELGYATDDPNTLKLNVELQEIRDQAEQRVQELQKAEEAFLKATARVRDARRGEDEETGETLRSIEQASEKELRELWEEHERWLDEGRTDVFDQVAEGLRKKADRIIAENEFGDVRKSVKQAEKVLAATDRVFEEEWRRAAQEREKEFRTNTESLKRKYEMRLRAAWQEGVARSERDQAAADLALRKVKAELRQLQARLCEKEKALGDAQEAPPFQSPNSRDEVSHQASRIRDGEAAGGDAGAMRSPREENTPVVLADSSPGHKAAFEKPQVIVVAPPTTPVPDGSPPEERTQPSQEDKHATAKDEVGKALGAILVQHGVITRDRLDEALAKQGRNHRPLGEILVESGYATREDIINALVVQSGVPYLPLDNYEVSEEAAGLVPGELARKLGVTPVDTIGDTLLIAMAIPLNNEQKQSLQRHVGDWKLKCFIAHWSDIKAKHEQHYS